MKTTLLGIALLLLGAGAGATAAGVMGYGPLAYISFHILSASEQQVTIIPTYLNLGNLSAGQKGNYTTNATITLTHSGNYSINLLHSELFDNLFSSFTIIVYIGDNQVVLSPEGLHSAVFYLSNGTYNINIVLYYQVAQQPQGPSNVTNLPFLILHPVGHGHDHDNGVGNQQGNDDNQGDESS